MADNAHEVAVSCRLGYQVHEPATLVLNVAASRVGQTVLEESWWLDRADAQLQELPSDGGSRLHRVAVSPGSLSLHYEARVGLPPAVHTGDPGPPPTPTTLDPQLLTLLRPSRYAQSDRVTGLTMGQFGDLAPGAEQAQAITDWIHENLAYVSGSTTAADSALETVLTRQGVCRDFVHLAIAYARACEIPARYASAYAPLLQPPDFHAVVELHLGGRWWVLDPTRLAPRASLVRIGTGRDAADCAFASILGGRVDGLAVEVAAWTLTPPPHDDHDDFLRADV